MASPGFAEVERKYDVDEDTPLPGLHELPGVSRVEQPAEYKLAAACYDTEDLVPASRHISLRRRTGGSGWPLKLPEAGGRGESHEPLGDGPGEMFPPRCCTRPAKAPSGCATRRPSPRSSSGGAGSSSRRPS